jgi:hypothetical protein
VLNRRSLMQLIIGMIAAFAGMMSVMVLRQQRCMEAGGQWTGMGQRCLSAGGPIPVDRGVDFMAGLGVGLLVAFMLYRASTFAARRRSRAPR